MTTETTTMQGSQNTPAQRDLHAQVTDTIIRQLEAGTVPWHQPWQGNSRILGLPKNAATGNSYNGINILLLWDAATTRDYPTQEWATFKQWQDKKECVAKGEKGSLIVYYDVMKKEVDGETQEIPFLKYSFVFNRCQLVDYKVPDAPTPRDPVDVMERILHVDEFVANTKAVIEHKGERACYIPSLDKIWMPERHLFTGTDTLTAQEAYYSTLLHELTHWTGHASRLNREGSKTFGDDAYAMEELVAELGAAFLCAELGIALQPKDDHASYIAHWLKMLKNNTRCVFKAANQASKAATYIEQLKPDL